MRKPIRNRCRCAVRLHKARGKRAELGLRFGRERVVRAVSLASVAVAIALDALASSGFMIVLALLMLLGASSYGDAGAINGG
jgi:hypothetical protein